MKSKPDGIKMRKSICTFYLETLIAVEFLNNDLLQNYLTTQPPRFLKSTPLFPSIFTSGERYQ